MAQEKLLNICQFPFFHLKNRENIVYFKGFLSFTETYLTYKNAIYFDELDIFIDLW